MNKMVYVAIIAAIATGLAAAINPTTQAYAQGNGNTQSNSFSLNSAQSQTANGNYGDVEQEQGFCVQANQQNAAAGRDATNSASNSIYQSDCS